MSDLVKRLRNCLAEFPVITEHPLKTMREAADRIEELQAQQQWQPIKTAPKDGTPILVAENSRDYPFVAYWGYVGRYTSSEKMWIGHQFGAMPDGSVTHWMPLPVPPQAVNEEDDED